MKTIIAGSRSIGNYQLVVNCIAKSRFKITEVVCGEANGVDKLGKEWAKKNKIPVKSFPAEWNKYGNAAGPIRNAQMADYGQALIAIWDGESKGTYNMIRTAQKNNLRIYIYLA